jgi:hypothetical protein
MSTPSNTAPNQYQWEVQPAAARWVEQTIAALADHNPSIRRLADVLRSETGTRLTDWVDYLTLASHAGEVPCQLADVGYVAESTATDGEVWQHPGGMFPPVVTGADRSGLAIRVDSIDDCLATLPKLLALDEVVPGDVVGTAGGPFRQACLAESDNAALWAAERHGYTGFTPPPGESDKVVAASRQLDGFRNRQRSFENRADGFAHTAKLIAAASEELGTAWACDLFFIAEREYWQSRNAAARVQYERQNRLGLGWANHDHHTYRSSRRAFGQLVAALEQFGFHCRERFYAGGEAGWGAQVLEQPECRLVVFADVDLSPDEVAGDFAHEELAERDELGTVGLWCELHGEAFFEAGMHHLECQFDFEAAREQLATVGVETLTPFTNFAFLRQAFTRGENWPVEPARVDRLLAAGRITTDQAERFRRDGAVGSHLEILERNDGYKGFNQTGVSDIIQRTDPRRMVGA